MDPKKDYYKILGVPEGASAEEIRKAFRRLAKKHHPDVNPGDKAAESRFKEANEAHEVLSDRKKREEYDAIRQGGFAGGFPGRRTVRRRGTRSRGVPGRVVRPRGSFRRRVSRRRGAVLRTPAGGATSGSSCPSTSSTWSGGRSARSGIPDPACAGSAGEPAAPGRRGCPACYGRGVTESEERVKIRIPAGARDGATIRVPSKGEERAAPGESGDLQVELRMLAHPYFRREGNDILLEAPIRFSEAVKGAKIEVPTIDGPVTVTIPPGSSSGRKLRLKGRGVPTPGTAERGDQYVVLQVVVPSERPEEFLRLVDRIAGFEEKDPRGHWN